MLTASNRSGSPVDAGAPAPDATFTDTEGRSVALSSLWRERPLLVVFLRHLGCIFCREQVARLRSEYPEFQAMGVQVACVAQGDPKTGKAFSIYFALPFPLLMCGDDISSYASYGLVRGTMGQLFGVRSLVRGIGAVLHGHAQGKIVGDGTQMPGAFLIDTHGTIRFVHRHKDAADNPPAGALAQAVRTALQEDTV